MKYPEDSKRMKAIIEYLGLTEYAFAQELGYKSAGSINQITRGVTAISEKHAERINDRFPQINCLYLIGEDEQMTATVEMQQVRLNTLAAAAPKPPDFEKLFVDMHKNMVLIRKELQLLRQELKGEN